MTTLKRWAEAIAQNALASLLFLGGTAVVLYLLTDAGNVLEVRVWWLAVGVVVLAGRLLWLLWLTMQVRNVRAQISTERTAAAPSTAIPHPHQDLLDRMDA